jgi:hypothetical protein
MLFLKASVEGILPFEAFLELLDFNLGGKTRAKLPHRGPHHPLSIHVVDSRGQRCATGKPLCDKGVKDCQLKKWV